MKKQLITFCLITLVVALSCKQKNEISAEERSKVTLDSLQKMEFKGEKFADIEILKYEIPNWKKLTLKEKKLVYYLSQAGYSGRDIYWDQNYKYNLKIRTALESIYLNYKGDKTTEEWKKFEIYLKRIWFSNGIHHHYSNDKIKPTFSQNFLEKLLKETNTNLDSSIVEVLFNDVDSKRVNLEDTQELIKGSSVNYYSKNITTRQAEEFYLRMKNNDSLRPLSFGLNSKLIRTESGKLEEKVWKSGGMYGAAIDKIIYWLEKAVEVAENPQQAKTLKLLIEFYKTGDLRKWDEYNIAWINATEGNIDYINGFIEVYNDPLGRKGAYESMVQIKDFDMSQKMKVLADHAQWFEDNSPLIPGHKKKNVVVNSYKTVIVASETGDTSPSSPIGVNLPNADWIRSEYGSKSVSLGNIIDALNNSRNSDRLKEFTLDENDVLLSKRYSELAHKLHTALHEVIGHASGQLNPGIKTPKETLKSYASTIEEGRADLFALYYLYDTKLQELGLVDDWEKLGKTAYNDFIRNGLMMQLSRIELGKNIEEAHMRNRQWISSWVFEKGQKDNVIEKVVKEGKTYFKINDYLKLRQLFGELLKETQRIKSEGDYDAARKLVENYGVKIDQQLHKEVLERNKQFNTPPYRGFVNPILYPIVDEKGDIKDVAVVYPRNFAEQMLYYSKNYHFLPLEN